MLYVKFAPVDSQISLAQKPSFMFSSLDRSMLFFYTFCHSAVHLCMVLSFTLWNQSRHLWHCTCPSCWKGFLFCFVVGLLAIVLQGQGYSYELLVLLGSKTNGCRWGIVKLHVVQRLVLVFGDAFMYSLVSLFTESPPTFMAIYLVLWPGVHLLRSVRALEP